MLCRMGLKAQSLQTCSICKTEKPLPEFCRDRTRASGFDVRCLACNRVRKMRMRGTLEKNEAARELTEHGLKRCTKCGEAKEIEFFGRKKLKSGALGHHSWCKACLSAATAAYVKRRYHSDPEFKARHNAASAERQKREDVRGKRREQQHDYRVSPEVRATTAQRTREWATAHPERVKELKNTWQNSNPEKMREYYRRYRALNREKIQARNFDLLSKRRWCMFNVGDGFPYWQRVLCRAFWNNACAYCGEFVGEPKRSFNDSHDHVVPISAGGGHSPSNVVLCCKGCNYRKNKIILDESLYAALAEQIERFVSLLPPESSFAGKGHPAAVRTACEAVAERMRGMGKPVGGPWLRSRA